MKKISFAIAACAIFAFAACGGGKTTENNGTADSLKQDSIKKASEAAAKASADSAAAKAAADSAAANKDKKGAEKGADKKADKK